MHKFRLMNQTDVPAVLAIQAQCYPVHLLEDEVTIRDRLYSAPDSTWVAADKSKVCAYLAAYRSVVGNITPLSRAFDIAEQADSLYLHDLAVCSSAQGAGIGQRLVRLAWERAQAQALTYSALVCVQGAHRFWQGLGYTVWDKLSPHQTASLHTYGNSSSYMIKQLS